MTCVDQTMRIFQALAITVIYFESYEQHLKLPRFRMADMVSFFCSKVKVKGQRVRVARATYRVGQKGKLLYCDKHCKG